MYRSLFSPAADGEFDTLLPLISPSAARSEEHTSELQSLTNLVCRLLLEKKNKLYGMLPADSAATSEGRTAADNATVRTVCVIGPDKKIKLQLSYPMTTRRTFDEGLQVRA